MKTRLQYKKQWYQVDLAQPLDISIPLRAGTGNVNCFYAPLMQVSPVVAGSFVGSTEQGGALNFMNVRFNPHGNGTHTECVGHISTPKYTINQLLKKFHFFGKLVSVFPSKQTNGDRVLTKAQMEAVFAPNEAPAIIIRTLPNDPLKQHTNYSGSNPPYVESEAIAYLVDCGVQHLLIDLPSIDREEDGGKLAAHKAFWRYPDNIRTECTISELIFVPNKIKDGLYLLNLQIASFEIDVSPSKPVLYQLSKVI